ncbi:unnamed protein product [Paramecium pentaurelia]|uniref:Uncharacterized protein n=1 Tax=Paramecium pentaurelia TaxID=43138 RepID=A0A8S1V5I6_9CILI|nr:unnamed protein product [Paramecium pentaurelia]
MFLIQYIGFNNKYQVLNCYQISIFLKYRIHYKDNWNESKNQRKMYLHIINKVIFNIQNYMQLNQGRSNIFINNIQEQKKKNVEIYLKWMHSIIIIILRNIKLVQKRKNSQKHQLKSKQIIYSQIVYNIIRKHRETLELDQIIKINHNKVNNKIKLGKSSSILNRCIKARYKLIYSNLCKYIKIYTYWVNIYDYEQYLKSALSENQSVLVSYDNLKFMLLIKCVTLI